MAALPPYRDSSDDTGVVPGIPRWVKVIGIITLVLILLVGIVMLTGVGGDHGPGRHTPSGDAGDTPPFGGYENTTGVGGPAEADEAARTVEVTTLDTMTFELSRIVASPESRSRSW